MYCPVFPPVGCLCGCFSLLTIAAAAKRQPSTVVTCIGTFEIILSYFSQIFIMGDPSDIYSIVGAAMVFLCIIAVTLEPGKKVEYQAPEEQDAETKSDTLATGLQIQK